MALPGSQNWPNGGVEAVLLGYRNSARFDIS